MRYLTIYNSSKTYYTPNMKELTSEMALQEYPILKSGLPCVIETDSEGIMFNTVPKPVHMYADMLGINLYDYDTIEDALRSMEDIINAPTPEPEPTAEERIAAALEFQNILMLPEEV